MSRKFAVLSFLVACFTVVLWSTVALAEEREQESREAQIKQLRGQIGELEQALERADTDKEAAELKGKLQERRKKLERLMGESRKPGEEFPEIQQAIRRANGNLEELRQAVKALKEEGEQTEKLKELQQRIAQEEKKLVELKNLLKKRRANAEQKRDRPRTKLMFLPVEHANAQNLSKIIQEFLTPSGIVVADPHTNIIVIKATPNDLEIASAIIKNLDIPRRRGGREQPRRDQTRRDQPRGDQPRRPQERREESDLPGREENGDVFFGKVLKAGRESLTIETRDSKEEVTLYVPVQRQDDGTSAPNEEMAVHVSRLEPGSNVRVQWRQGDVRRLIVRVSKLEE
jgi:predicted  nucleic acid-binding Zn-ribbon protein